MSVGILPAPSKPFLIIVLAVGIACLAALSMHHQLEGDLALLAQPISDNPELFRMPEPSALRVMGLGHTQMMADLIWIQALSYFAVHHTSDREYQWLERHIETVVALDPDFRKIYHWAGIVVMYGGQEINNEAVRASIRFLELGVELFPDDWELNFMLGVNYRWELVPESEQEARQLRLLGARYLRAAATLPGAPSWLALSARRNLAAFGDVLESIAVAAHAFLDRRGMVMSTYRAEQALYRNSHLHRNLSQLETTTIVGAGVSLRSYLSASEWWDLLVYRRLQFEEHDSPIAYLPWGLRENLYGDLTLRVGWPEWTPLDVAFYPTLHTADEFDDL